jgi:hypothetical protein
MLEIIQKNEARFNPKQMATAARIALASLHTSFRDIINTPSSRSLRAQEKMWWLLQAPLPDNQWEIEVLSWEQAGLAALQASVQEYAAGPTIAVEGIFVSKMWSEKVLDNAKANYRALNQAWRSICHNQIVRVDQGTLNFSVVGIAIIFTLGILIVVMSFVVVAAVPTTISLCNF